MFKPTGDGKAAIQIDKVTGVIRVWLFNFDVDGDRVKREHTKVLIESIAPAIRDGGAIKFMGLASTTGSDGHNINLAERRLKAVIAELRRLAGTKFKITQVLNRGS